MTHVNVAPRVLAVFPDPTFCADLTVSLRSAGLNVCVCGNSMAALTVLDRERVDFLVTALEMPPGNPHGLALGLMARLRKASVRVLVLAEGENIDYPAINDTAVHVIRRPVSFDDAAAIVHAVVAGHGPEHASGAGLETAALQ
jgi:DNA-binding NtrC family response regulator